MPVSELMAGENVIELRLTGSGGSTFTSVFRIILGMTKLYFNRYRCMFLLTFLNGTKVCMNEPF